MKSMSKKHGYILAVVLVVISSILILLTAPDEPKLSSVSQTSNVCSLNANKLLGYINEERSLKGATELVVDSKLAVASKQKLDLMVGNHYFGHDLIGGGKWSELIRAQGFTGNISEDIGSSDKTPTLSWNEFKNSPNHYESLTNPVYTRIGIAVECTDYFVENTVDIGDENIIGDHITDLTVISLSD